MAESTEDLPHPVENQPSASHPHVKVKLKRSSASWEVHIDEDERDDATCTYEKGDTIAAVPKQQTVFKDCTTGIVEKPYVKSCSDFQNDLLCGKISDSADTRTTVDCQKRPSRAKEGDLPHRCDLRISEVTLPPDEKSSLAKEADLKVSLKLSSECRNVRPSCPETLTHETPRTGYKCTKGSGNEPSRLDTVRPSCPETVTHEKLSAGDNCTEGTGNEPPRLELVRPSCPETVTHEKPSPGDNCAEGLSYESSRLVSPSCPEILTHEKPRTENKCTEASGNGLPRSDVARPNCPETVTHVKPRTGDNCTEGSSNEVPRLDAVRERCMQLLVQAFQTETHNIQLVRELATSIEDHIFSEFKHTGTKYKNRVRSRVANLKDPRNPELRRRLIQGEITPQQMATMSAQEMASEEVKKFRRQVSEESIQRRQVPHADGIMTDMFKCENCGRENCCYNQYRGFSADGPIASPFVFCMECGNRWKFF